MMQPETSLVTPGTFSPLGVKIEHHLYAFVHFFP